MGGGRAWQGGMHGRGCEVGHAWWGHAWQGGEWRGYAWQGGMHGKGCAWWGGMFGKGGMHVMQDMLPPVDRMTDACKNITLLGTSFVGGKYCR